MFNRDHDGCLKIALKARKIAEEVCEYERFKERITEILDSLAEEKKKKRRRRRQLLKLRMLPARRHPRRRATRLVT